MTTGDDRALAHLFDRRPFNSPPVRAAWNRVLLWLLPAWFAFNTLTLLLYLTGTPSSFGFDARLYRMAAEAWLAGYMAFGVIVYAVWVRRDLLLGRSRNAAAARTAPRAEGPAMAPAASSDEVGQPG
jgi:hypothetical protein